MSLRRLATGWVDTERSCALPECGAPAPVEPHQRAWPAQVEDLRNQARAYARLAAAKNLEADALEAEIRGATTPAWLCLPHREHLHDPLLRTAWGGGRHDAADTATIERTVDYLHDPSHQPGLGGACAVCRPGARHREEVPVQ